MLYFLLLFYYYFRACNVKPVDDNGVNTVIAFLGGDSHIL